MNNDFVKTTFIYKGESQWKFKHIAALRRKKIRDVTSTLMDRYIEDYQDEKIYDRIKREIQEVDHYIEWNSFKRGMGLDGVQNFS